MSYIQKKIIKTRLLSLLFFQKAIDKSFAGHVLIEETPVITWRLTRLLVTCYITYIYIYIYIGGIGHE
jgi:hypothetical protein